MQSKPFSKELYEKAIKLGINLVELNFSGGSDNGFLNVEASPGGHPEFEQEVIHWADETYEYSGGGEGIDYGDDIVYDFDEMTVTCREWYMEPQTSEDDPVKLEIEQ